MPQARAKINHLRKAEKEEIERSVETPSALSLEENEELIEEEGAKDYEPREDDFLEEDAKTTLGYSYQGPPSPSNYTFKSETLTKVEKILEKDMGDIYFKMSPEAKRNFKIKGEEISLKIEEMIETGKAVARKILALIKSWLQMIPGVNRFFLEQEAKIKTDKIMNIVEKGKEEAQ
jgi:hypothetical protein